MYGCPFIIPDSPRIHRQKQDQQTHLHSGIRYSRKPSRASGPLTGMEKQPSTRCRQTSRHSSPPCSSDCSAPSRHLEGITGAGTVTTCRPDDGALSCLPYGLVPLQGGSSCLVLRGKFQISEFWWDVGSTRSTGSCRMSSASYSPGTSTRKIETRLKQGSLK